MALFVLSEYCNMCDGKILESEIVEGDEFNDGVMIRDVSESSNAFISRIVRIDGVNEQ